MHGRERILSDVLVLLKSEDSLDLAIIDMFLELDDVGVQFFNVVNVGEDESFFGIEPKRENIFDVVLAHLIGTLRPVQLNLLLVQVLLIVRDLDHQRHIEGLLEPLRENEGHTVTHVECVSRGTSARVEEKGLLLLVSVQNLVKVTLAEENAATNKSVRFFACETLHTINLILCNVKAPVFVNEFIVVNSLVVLCDDFKRRDHVFGSCWCGSRCRSLLCLCHL